MSCELHAENLFCFIIFVQYLLNFLIVMVMLRYMSELLDGCESKFKRGHKGLAT